MMSMRVHKGKDHLWVALEQTWLAVDGDDDMHEKKGGCIKGLWVTIEQTWLADDDEDDQEDDDRHEKDECIKGPPLGDYRPGWLAEEPLNGR